MINCSCERFGSLPWRAGPNMHTVSCDIELVVPFEPRDSANIDCGELGHVQDRLKDDLKQLQRENP